MLDFSRLPAAWESPEFDLLFKAEVARMGKERLPLQQGLAHSSYVSDEPYTVMILDRETTGEQLRVRAGIFYSGIVAGCSCADDPTPIEPQTEYCVVQIDIDRHSGMASVTLLP